MSIHQQASSTATVDMSAVFADLKAFDLSHWRIVASRIDSDWMTAQLVIETLDANPRQKVHLSGLYVRAQRACATHRATQQRWYRFRCGTEMVTTLSWRILKSAWFVMFWTIHGIKRRPKPVLVRH
jgi:hypothetical protein